MQDFYLERLSVDLSNRCSKACDFCYNHSSAGGDILWQPEELIRMVRDCVGNGLKAVSLGGGEPLEYPGVFEVIAALTPLLFVSVTTNGLPLAATEILRQLKQNKPDKIHFSIHAPDNMDDIRRALNFCHKLKNEDIRTGINLLVSADKIPETKRLTAYLLSAGIARDEIIFIPRKYSLQPTARQLSEAAGNAPFQSAACLTGCKKSHRFCSVSWDKQVSFCSYSPSKAPLREYSHRGIISALETVKLKNCTL